LELWGDDILQALRVANIDMVIIIGFVFGKKLGIFQQRNWENFEFFFF
jgi:Na+/H+ antiporter NhaA